MRLVRFQLVKMVEKGLIVKQQASAIAGQQSGFGQWGARACDFSSLQFASVFDGKLE